MTADSDPDPDAVRLWLVERSYDDRNLITLVYATPDGERMLRKEQAATIMRQRGASVTAAVDAEPAALDAVPEEDRDRYAEEAARTAAGYEPGEEV
ncbi:hypothetical protein [Halegenticoccus tardaugens]|uniref:hypothetical protein n=1 Tax=Halegenticoccus tardaugens TaxID=2071624 RepID=UPI00100AE54D|nr:hypothetical protein [Halegenticoccus tardaugens]